MTPTRLATVMSVFRSPSLLFALFVFFNDTATTEIYTYDTHFPYTTLFRSPVRAAARRQTDPRGTPPACSTPDGKPLHRRLHAAPPACGRSEEHTSELQSLMRTSYAVFCWKKKAICLIVQWDDAVLFRENGRAHV